MDKYEFTMKVEQLKKRVKLGDYETAMKIADGIDWRRVTSVSLLSMVSEVYEKNREYDEAKAILVLANERAPIGKRILYKLTMLSLQEGNINEAESYYRDFYDLAPDDPRQHILRYLILKAKGAPAGQLINSLEQYNRAELNEKWMYELAETYYRAGRMEDCVKECDEIMLMFGIGNYVDKAIDLKVNRVGQPLTEYQQSLVQKREDYQNLERERLAELQNADGNDGEDRDEYDEAIAEHMAALDSEVSAAEEADMADDANMAAEAAMAADMAMGAGAAMAAEPAPQIDAEPMPEPVNVAPAASETAPAEEAPKTKYTVNFLVERRTPEEGVEAAVRLLKLMHEYTGSTNKVAKISATKLNTIGLLASRAKLADKDIIVTEAGDLTYTCIGEIITLVNEEPDKRVIVLEDNPVQVNKILGAYPEILKVFHLDKDEETQAEAPAPAATAAAAQETAAPAATQTAPAASAPTVSAPMATSASAPTLKEDTRPVYRAPETRNAIQETFAPVEKKTAVQETFAPTNEQAETQAAIDESIRDAKRELKADFVVENKKTPTEVKSASAPKAAPARQVASCEAEMDIDEFAQAAAEYAKSIDCVITGKSMLALYERIEIMEEEGIPLTKDTAVALIEEAADRAEKPKLGRLFSPKYDKEDRLILKEEHFIP